MQVKPISSKHSRIAVVLCLTFILSMLPLYTAHAITTPLLNGGAESGNTSDWVPWGRFTTATGSGSAHGGSAYFAADHAGDHSRANSALYQDVDVSGYANVIDNPPGTNKVKAIFSGYLGGDGNDRAMLRVECLDSSGDIIGSWETDRRAYSSWTHVEETYPQVPAGTRTIRFKMRSYREAGAQNDGYFDDLSLILYIPTSSSMGNWTGNRLTNPGAESGLDGWNYPTFTSVAGSYQYEPGYSKPSVSGSRFWAATSEFICAWAYQDIDLTEHADAVDSEGVTAILSGSLSSKYDGGDEAQFWMMYLDQNGSEIGYAATGYKARKSWGNYEVSNIVPANTRALRVIMEGREDYGYGALLYTAFDDLSLELHLPRLESTDMPTAFAFGNLYLETETNPSPRDYNRSVKKAFSFKNAGDERSTLSWSLSFEPSNASDQATVQFSQSSGTLAKGDEQSIEAWYEGFVGEPGERLGTILLTSGRGDREIDVSATAWRITEINSVTPATGTNGEVNIALNDSTKLALDTTETHPDANVAYRWQKRSRNEQPGSGFDETSGTEKYYTFSDPGQYSIYCKAVEKLNGKEVETDLLEIPVHAWTRPTVSDTPPQVSIDAGDVSWFSGKYAGVNGQPVRIMSDGEAATTGQGESIDKFIWSFDADWDTIELEQPAGMVASYTWNNAADSRIRCKAVTNFGVTSGEKLFDLKVYDPPQLHPGDAYTGRVNTAIQLEGGLDNSYPGATVDYQWRVDSVLPDGTLKGAATHQGDYIELTALNTSLTGQVEYGSLPLGSDFSLAGEFWSGGGTGADAFYVYLWAHTTPTMETGQARGQYSIAFDEFTGNGGIQFYDGEADQVLQVVEQPIPLDNSEWRPFRITFLEGTFRVYLDHQLKMTQEVTNYATRMANNPLSGFGGRTGDQTNYHRVRNAEWTTGIPVETDSQGQAEHTWSEEGTHLIGLTVQVTTTEGLVLEKTEYAQVRIEAGVPTAMPGGPYRGGIAGGSYSPIQFEGNHPDYIEAEDVGKITDWAWFLSGGDNGSLQLDGMGDHVIVNPVGVYPTDMMTVEFWMKTSDADRQGTLVSYAVPGNSNALIIYNYQNFEIIINNKKNSPTEISANDGSWHHIAVTWTSTAYTDSQGVDHPDGEVKLYKDGAEVYSNVLATGDTFTGGGALVIGQEQDSVGGRFDSFQAFEGNIDEVRFWNRVRSQDEIRADMGRELIGTESGLVLYYQFKDGAGTHVTDATGLNDGILVTTAGELPDNRWLVDGYPAVKQGMWNPNHSFVAAGTYEASLRVLSESGKWSTTVATDVEVVDGKIAGYVRAADLRTPVREVTLTLTSSHVAGDALIRVASTDPSIDTTDAGGLSTLTNEQGYYEFAHLPLGSYRIVANKGSGDGAHEFETKVKVTELTLDSPNQLAIDFVDLSVFPVGGRVVYSIQKNGQDVLVSGVDVKAQPVSSTSAIEALPSTSSLTATGTNYSLPLFAGKYLFIANNDNDDIRLVGTNPDDPNRTPPSGYDSGTGLVTIEDARSDIDFINYTSHTLTVFVEDSGEYKLSGVEVEISGDNGQAIGLTDDEEGKFEATLNPGIYTVTVAGGMPVGESVEQSDEVDLTGGDAATTMVIPSKIEVTIAPPPRLFDASQEFMDEFGLTVDDNPENYMFYYGPAPVTHTYTITATSNGHPVEDFTITVVDEVSLFTADDPDEQMLNVQGEEGEYTITAGLPKRTADDPPLAAPKKVQFTVTKDGYKGSDVVEEQVIVLGDVPVGAAGKTVSIPVVNYTVLHDPPGDGSYAYLSDSMSISGIIVGMQQTINDEEVRVYPSPWSTERDIESVSFDEDPDSGTKFKDLNDRGLLGYHDPDSPLTHFGWAAAGEAASGAIVVLTGPVGYFVQLAKLGTKAALITPGSIETGYIQYQVSPSRTLSTASGDSIPDLMGPGKGDIYFGEGWTLGLQTKYRMGIECTGSGGDCVWKRTTEKIETYDILERTNQYIYTPRDIENIIEELSWKIADTTNDGEKNKLIAARTTWQTLLDKNYGYVYARDYLSPDGAHYGEPLDNFYQTKGWLNDDGEWEGHAEDTEILMFSAGPTFEYSRSITESDSVSMSTSLSLSSSSAFRNSVEISNGVMTWGTGFKYKSEFGSSASIGSSTSYSSSWTSGTSSSQSIGFVLHDNDVGDNIATRVMVDPWWGTPLFFAEPGSYTSDPWEPGTSKSVDFTMELIDAPTGSFDYQDGAHYTVRLTYTGQRELESSSIAFSLFASATGNTEHLKFLFNGRTGGHDVYLSKNTRTADMLISVYPPESDRGNSEDKTYPVVIGAIESADVQIYRSISEDITFSDLTPPSATIAAPHDGQRISPEFFPTDDPFDIEVVSENTDLAKIQLQIRSKQPDGVWEPWYNLSGMIWEDGGGNESVTVFDRLDRRPPRREFTFSWDKDAIEGLGVGEYAIRAVATDKATNPNTDIDPPSVVFLVDTTKPSVLNSLPDYQARESERIYRGELSVTFTDDMRATDFDDRTFYVVDLLNNNMKVSGYVSYSPALRKTVFVPQTPFQPNGYYRVEIKTDVDTDGDGSIDERGVHDLAGNPLDNAFMWTFRTTDAPFEETWSLNWRVSAGELTDANNIVAVAYGATDLEDEKDVRAVPRLDTQIQLCFLDQNRIEFDRDMRPADGRLAHHWFMVTDNAPNGSTVTLEYQPSVKLTKTTRQYQMLRLIEFDQDGNVSNTISLDPTQASADPVTGEISYVQAYQYVNQGEASRYFRLDVQKASYVADRLTVGTSGWKFLSVPIIPQRPEPFVNLGDDIDPFQLFQYDTALSGYKVYPYDIGEVGLQTGHGYFTRLSEDVDVDVGGSSNQSDVTLTLDTAGWHAIGNPFIEGTPVADWQVNGQAFSAAANAGIVNSTLYRWDTVSDVPHSDSYQTVTVGDTLAPWDAVWLKTSQADVTLVIPVPANLPNQAPTPDYLRPPMAPASVDTLARLQVDTLGEGGFRLPLMLTSASASDVTTMLGTHTQASVGTDRFDQSEPPRLADTVSAYFLHTDGEMHSQFDRDYQSLMKPGESRTWELTLSTDQRDAELQLSWVDAIADVPDDVMLWIRDTLEGSTLNPQHSNESDATWSDMRQTTSLEFTSTERHTRIPLEIRAERFALSPPQDVQVVAGEQQVTVRWQAEDSPFVTGYSITRDGLEVNVPTLNVQHSNLPTSETYHEFVDDDVAEEQTYTYQVMVHYITGTNLSSEPFTVTVLPFIKETVLLPAYPNPFNPDTWIPYELEREVDVNVSIYDVHGRRIRQLALGTQPRGRYISREKAVHWDGRTYAGERAGSGVYFVVLKAGDHFTATRKLVIRK